MKKDVYQDVMWLFQELGKHLARMQGGEGEAGDTRALLAAVAQQHIRQDYRRGRNPLNWLKELQSTCNYWHHLSVDGDVSNEDVWRDLDTLLRVSEHLRLDGEFVESVRAIRDQQFVESVESDAHSELDRDELRQWIREEVTQQLAGLPARTLAVSPTVEARSPRRHDEGGANNSGTIADRVRSFVLEVYIDPARSDRQKEVSVRAGDVDKALGYRYRRLPLVCTALRSQKFLTMAHAHLIGETGPPSGASTTTTLLFRLLD